MSRKHKKYNSSNNSIDNKNTKTYNGDSSMTIHQSDEIDNVENNEKIKVYEYNDLISEMKDAKEVLDALNSHRLSNEIDKLIMYLMDQNYKLNRKYTKISNDYSKLLADFRNYKKVSRSTAIYVNDLENSDYDKESLIESVKAFAVSKEKEVGEKNRQIQSLYEVIDTINEHNPSINGTSIHEIVRTNEIKDKSIDYLTTMNNDLKDKNEILNDKYINLLEKYNNTLTNYKYRNYQVNVMREWTSQIKEDLITGHLTSLSLLSQLNDHLTNIVDNYEIYSNNYEFELENDENIKIIKEDIKEISEFIFEYSKNRAKKDNIKPINPHKDGANSISEFDDQNEKNEKLTIEPIEEELNSYIEEESAEEVDSDLISENPDTETDNSLETEENSELDEFIEDLLEFKDAENEKEDIKVVEDGESGSDSLILELETPSEEQINNEEVLDDINEDIKDDIVDNNSDIYVQELELDKENIDEEAEYTEISKPEFEKLLNTLFDSEDDLEKEDKSEVEIDDKHLDTEDSVKELIEVDNTEKVIDDEIKTDINKEIRDLEEFVNDKTIDKDVLARMVGETLDSADNTSHEFNFSSEKYDTKKGDNIIDLEVSNTPDEIEELDINELLLDESDVNVSKKTANKYIDSEKTLESKSIIGANAKKSAKTAINSLLVDKTVDDNDAKLLNDDYDDIEDLNDIDIIDEYIDNSKKEQKSTVIDKSSNLEETDYNPIETDYTPIKTDYTPIETDYSPIETNYNPVETDYNPIETDYTPVETDYTPIEIEPINSEEIKLTDDEIENINDVVEEEMKPKDYGIDITTIKIDDEKEDIKEEMDEIQSDEITEESVDNILENFSLDEVDITDIDI